VISSIPSVIAGGHAIAPFIISILILALGTGFIKSCVAPIIADQSPVKTQTILTLSTGEKVIVDPGQTIQSMLMVFLCSRSEAHKHTKLCAIDRFTIGL